MENVGAARKSARLSAAVRGDKASRVSAMSWGRVSTMWRTRGTTATADSAIRVVRMTLHSMNNNLARVTINWAAVIMGTMMIVVTSGQGLFLGVLSGKLEACKAQVTETMTLADTVLVVVSGFVVLGIAGRRYARGEASKGDEDDENLGVVNCTLLPKLKVFKFMCVGALGTVDNIMYLQAMTYHNPAAVMILRLACSLVLLTLGQMVLRRLTSTKIQVFGLVPLVLSAVTHILAAASEEPAGGSGKPQISTQVLHLIVLIACPFTAAAEVLGTDLLFAQGAPQQGGASQPEAEPHQALAFGLNSAGAALMDACIHLGINGGQFPVHSFGCVESAVLVAIAAMYVFTYKVAIVACGGMASVVLRVLNPMVTYVATCLVLQKQPDLERSVSGLTVLSLVAWYNMAPIWDAHVSLVAKKKTIAQAAKVIEHNIRKSRAASPASAKARASAAAPEPEPTAEATQPTTASV